MRNTRPQMYTASGRSKVVVSKQTCIICTTNHYDTQDAAISAKCVADQLSRAPECHLDWKRREKGLRLTFSAAMHGRTPMLSTPLFAPVIRPSALSTRHRIVASYSSAFASSSLTAAVTQSTFLRLLCRRCGKHIKRTDNGTLSGLTARNPVIDLTNETETPEPRALHSRPMAIEDAPPAYVQYVDDWVGLGYRVNRPANFVPRVRQDPGFARQQGGRGRNRRRQPVCFRCGQVGHIVTNCPRRQRHS